MSNKRAYSIILAGLCVGAAVFNLTKSYPASSLFAGATISALIALKLKD